MLSPCYQQSRIFANTIHQQTVWRIPTTIFSKSELYCSLVLLALVFMLINFAPVIIILELYTPRGDDESNPLTRSMLSSSMAVGNDT